MDESGIKLSVILPAYNAEKYIANSIQSVIRQNFRQIELIIINDGSTDHTRQICERFQNEDYRIKLINSRNKGAGAARNKGLGEAKGDFIAFVDADDWIDAVMYQKMMAEFTEDIDVVVCGIEKEYPEGSSVKGKNNVPYKSKVFESKEAYEKLFRNGYLGNKIYRRQTIHNLKFIENIKIEEDWIYNIKAFYQAKRVKFINQNYYHYLQNDNSVLHQKDYESILTTLHVIQQLIADCPANDTKLKDSLVREYFSIVNYSMVWTLPISNKNAIKYFRTSQKELRKGILLVFCDRILPLKTKLVMLVQMFLPHSFCKILWELK